MDKYSPGAAGNRSGNDDFGHYKSVPAGEADNGYGFPKSRKRNSKKIDDAEEIPFSDMHMHKPVVRPQNTNSEQPGKEPSCLKNALLYFCNFCDSTSIHGFKFLGERGGRYIVEKLWWFMVVILAMYGSGTLIYQAYQKWVTAPVLVSFETTETPIWKIPFPAVTICPEINSNPSIFNYSDVYTKYFRGENVTDEEYEYFNLFSLVCDADNDYIDEENTTLIDYEQFEKFLFAFAEVEGDTCKWNGNPIVCNETMSYTLTSEGWCSTFNMLDSEEIYADAVAVFETPKKESTKAKKWSLEHGYPPNAGLNTYPRRTLLSGVEAGFQIDLFVDDSNLDYICSELQGFKVVLHHPGEEPNMDNYFRVPLDQAVVAAVKPRMITTSEEIKNYSPEDRQCYLSEEKPLRYFKIYTQQNCMTECLKNYTEKICNCSPFHLYALGFEGESICGAGSKACVEQAKVSFLENEVEQKLQNNKWTDKDECGCLPPCAVVEFEVETSQTDWNWRKTFHFKQHNPKIEMIYEKDHFSRLMVYYKDMQFMTSKRHELYGTVDFLSTCGGLLGLFCGFSFTSSMEILYYLTLRLLCNLKKFGRRVWSGDPELVEQDEERKHQNQLE